MVVIGGREVVMVVIGGEGGCHGRDHINVVSFKPCSGEVYLIQHYVIKFLSDFRQVSGFSGYSSFLHQ